LLAQRSGLSVALKLAGQEKAQSLAVQLEQVGLRELVGLVGLAQAWQLAQPGA